MFRRSRISLTLLIALAPTLAAQTGGQFDLSHNVIAGGGTQSSSGTITVAGTAGQAIAGIQSSGSTLSVRGGFWAFQQLAPTAAGTSISGSVQTANGVGIFNARLTLTNVATGEVRTVLSSSFGFYRFDDVPVGEFYQLQVGSKRYIFKPDVQLFNLVDELTGADFIAAPLN